MAIDLIEQFLNAEMSWDDLDKILSSCADMSSIQFALRIGDAIWLHESIDIPAQSFDTARADANEYLKYIRGLNPGGWVCKREIGKIEGIREKPSPSRPIYLISSEDEEAKTIVYIGRTSSNTSRFECGHAAITKLHAPEFNGKSKFVYMCAVLVRVNESDWVPIEFHPQGQFFLERLEAQLVFQIKPCLNSNLINKLDNAAFIILHDNRHKLKNMDGHFFDISGSQHLPEPS